MSMPHAGREKVGLSQYGSCELKAALRSPASRCGIMLDAFASPSRESVHALELVS